MGKKIIFLGEKFIFFPWKNNAWKRTCVNRWNRRFHNNDRNVGFLYNLVHGRMQEFAPVAQGWAIAFHFCNYNRRFGSLNMPWFSHEGEVNPSFSHLITTYWNHTLPLLEYNLCTSGMFHSVEAREAIRTAHRFSLSLILPLQWNANTCPFGDNLKDSTRQRMRGYYQSCSWKEGKGGR